MNKFVQKSSAITHILEDHFNYVGDNITSQQAYQWY